MDTPISPESPLSKQIAATIESLQDLHSSNLINTTTAQSMIDDSYIDAALNESDQKLKIMLKQAVSSLRQELNTSVSSLSEDLDSFQRTFVQKIKEESSSSTPKEARFFAQKVHKFRMPWLSTMLRNDDIRTIYNIFLSIMLVMILGVVMNEFLTTGNILNLSLVYWAFGKLNIAVPFWVCMVLWSLTVVYLVVIISENKLGKRVWIPAYITLQVLLYASSCVFAIYNKLPIATAFFITIEMARISMKMHSYFREKMLFGMGKNEYSHYIPPNLIQKGITIQDLTLPTITVEDEFTELRRFIYFFFAPTLIYRDSYPRLCSKIRWRSVMMNLINVLGTIAYAYIIIHSVCIPQFRESIQVWDLKHFMMTTFKSMFPGTILLLLMFFGFLHSWQNMGAELFKFADRHFYEDWWNVRDFGVYFRKWNIVVHEWLYYYVYQDLVRFSHNRIPKLINYLIVFLVSDIIHELIICCTFRFVYPILFVLFGGPGLAYTFILNKDSRLLNIVVWSSFLIGNGLILMFYSWEYFARQSIDLRDRYGVWAYFIPHSWVIGRL
jgi:sterol O-acyltransferase